MPSISQRQADMMQHAAHDKDYAVSRGVPFQLAKDQHQENITAGEWGKVEKGPCPKCPAEAEAAQE